LIRTCFAFAPIAEALTFAIGLLADLMRVRQIPRAPTLTSQR
jgi:hypothetical protein